MDLTGHWTVSIGMAFQTGCSTAAFVVIEHLWNILGLVVFTNTTRY